MKVWLNVLITCRRPGVLAVRIDGAREHPSGRPHPRAFTAGEFERITAAAQDEVSDAFLAGTVGWTRQLGTSLIVELDDLVEQEG